YTSGVNCKSCGEQMEGDGYNTVLHCPNASEETWWDHEPDANPEECFCYPGSGQTDSPARITEQEEVEILESFWRSTDDREDWVKGEDGQSLLNRLNQDREQVPAVAVPDGFKLVPISCSPEMWDAGSAAHQSPACIYHAMVKAAPPHSQQ